MKRDLNTPLILWIAVIAIAVRLHMMAAEGGDYVAMVHNDHRALATLGDHVRDRVRSQERTLEITGLDTGHDVPEVPPPPPEPPKPEPKKDKPLEISKPTPEKKATPPKPEEKKVPLIAKKDEEKPPSPSSPLQPDKRIAVRQHAKPNQEDNPNARFVGDEANHVEQETVATQTSHDRDDENPTPGGNHPGSDSRAGDSDRTKIAESEDHAGDKTHAPGERGTEFDVQREPPPERPMGPVAVQAPPSNQAPRAGGDNRTPSPSPVAPPQLPPGAAGPTAQTSDANPQTGPGDWTFNPIRPGATGGVAQAQGPGSSSSASPQRQNTPPTQWLGLGGRTGAGQVNLNLNPQGVVAVVGQDQLRKEREADGERRKSEHRGSWTASNFERWRSAIENYVSSVKPGNQTALNTAAVPFATYLNGMHQRIHPIFADSFLGSLGGLPAGHPMNDQKLITRLEIVLTKDGHLIRMGVVKTSGVTAFDIAALDSVQRSSPFGAAPSAIVSPDGRVYLHWEFHRDEVFACSTMNARPFLLNTPATAPPTEPQTPTPPSTPGPSRERGAPPINTQDTREGMVPVVLRRASAT